MAHVSSLSSYPFVQHSDPATSRAWTPAFQTYGSGSSHEPPVPGKRNTVGGEDGAYASSSSIPMAPSRVTVSFGPGASSSNNGNEMRRAAAAIARDTLLLSLLSDSNSRGFAEDRCARHALLSAALSSP
jgi:hypothetical protein